MSLKKHFFALGLSAILVVSLAGCGASNSGIHNTGTSNHKANNIMIPAKNQSNTQSSSKKSNGLMIPAKNQSSVKSPSTQSNNSTVSNNKRYH